MAFADFSDISDITNTKNDMASYDQYRIEYEHRNVPLINDGTSRTYNNEEFLKILVEKISKLEKQYNQDYHKAMIDQKSMQDMTIKVKKLEYILSRFIKDSNEEVIESAAEVFTPTLEQEWRKVLDQFNIIYTDEQIDQLSQKYKIPTLKSEKFSVDEKKKILEKLDFKSKETKYDKWVSTGFGTSRVGELAEDTVEAMMELENKINQIPRNTTREERDFASYWSSSKKSSRDNDDEVLRRRRSLRDQIIATTKSF